jgi:hypothetical protein
MRSLDAHRRVSARSAVRGHGALHSRRMVPESGGRAQRDEVELRGSWVSQTLTRTWRKRTDDDPAADASPPSRRSIKRFLPDERATRKELEMRKLIVEE